MPTLLERLRMQIEELNRRLSREQRLFFFAGIAIVLLGIAAFFFMSSRPDYVVLFSNLSHADQQAIARRLTASKAPYKVSGDGTTVTVPAGDRDKLRVQLAQEGLPNGTGVGLEYLDKPSLYDTEPTLRAK